MPHSTKGVIQNIAELILISPNREVLHTGRRRMCCNRAPIDISYKVWPEKSSHKTGWAKHAKNAHRIHKIFTKYFSSLCIGLQCMVNVRVTISQDCWIFFKIWISNFGSKLCCYRLSGKGRSVAPMWPRLTARLQRSVICPELTNLSATGTAWATSPLTAWWSTRPSDRLNFSVVISVSFVSSDSIFHNWWLLYLKKWNCSIIMRPSLGNRIKHCTRPSVCLSVCPSVQCLRFSRNRRAVETANLKEIYG